MSSSAISPVELVLTWDELSHTYPAHELIRIQAATSAVSTGCQNPDCRPAAGVGPRPALTKKDRPLARTKKASAQIERLVREKNFTSMRDPLLERTPSTDRTLIAVSACDRFRCISMQRRAIEIDWRSRLTILIVTPRFL